MPAPSPSLVSIVIPTFNYGRFIGETLDSVLAQSLPTWECLVIDDGSTDDTASIVSAYTRREPRISYTFQENAGLSAARNSGLRLGKGQYFQFLDADDFIEPRKLEWQTSYLEAHPHVGIVYGPARYFPSDKPAQHRYARTDPDDPWMPEVSGSGSDVLPVLLKTNIMPVNSPLVRREVIRRVGYFNEGLRALEDWDYWTRCALFGAHFQFLDREGSYALVRIHPESMSNEALRMQAAIVRHYQATLGLAPDRASRRTLRGYLNHARKTLARLHIADGSVLTGSLAMVRAALADHQYWLAATFTIAFLLTPILGRRRFATWACGSYSLKKVLKSRLLGR